MLNSAPRGSPEVVLPDYSRTNVKEATQAVHKVTHRHISLFHNSQFLAAVPNISEFTSICNMTNHSYLAIKGAAMHCRHFLLSYMRFHASQYGAAMK